ncbi:hypothetical protein EOD23_10905 [Mesorhizobium sp. USDA-HM6]|nr:hypothetical protein EOD23_10905 [Mesorhizobium sp. USDA-HM6]
MKPMVSIVLLLKVFVRIHRKVGAAPHPPDGTFSPYSDGEKEEAPTPAPPSPRSSRREGKGEGQRQRWLKIA